MTSRKILGILAVLSLTLIGSSAAQGGGFGARYVFRGHLLATPPANATSISISVEGGNKLALQKMLGSSVNQTFTVGTGTEFLKWSHGIPTVVHSNDLTAGDWVVVRVRAPWNATLSQIEARPPGLREHEHDHCRPRCCKSDPASHAHIVVRKDELRAPAHVSNA